MNISASVIKAVQHACHMPASDIDGVYGPRTLAAAREYDIECDDFYIPMSDTQKLIVTVAQHAAGLRDRALDGVYGPGTEKAVQVYLHAHGIEGTSPKKPAASSSWAEWKPCEDPGIYKKDGIDLLDGKIIVPPGAFDSIPSKKQLDAVFGDAKTLGESGMSKRMTTLDKLPGRFNHGNGVLPMVHEKVAPHARLALELMATFGMIDEVYKIWFFNYRHMRHDTSMPLSLHSWGIACDINSKENFAWYPKDKEKEIQPFQKSGTRSIPGA